MTSDVAGGKTEGRRSGSGWKRDEVLLDAGGPPKGERRVAPVWA